jgi:putative flippase GtrA
MTSLPDKIAGVGLRVLPAPVARRLQTEAGKRFARFIPVALAAVITSQVILGLLTGPVNLNAGWAGVIASMAAALVSYLLSRWAWERKGKPDLLRETLPFWVISLAVWGILGLTSHYADAWAHSMGYTHIMKHLVVQGSYFLMNCITFVARFLIFHYVLFARRDQGALKPVPEELPTAGAMSAGGDTGPMPAFSGDGRPSGPGPHGSPATPR